MNVSVRTAKRLEIDMRIPGARATREVHVVELVVGGVVYRTEAASAMHAYELAVRTARDLGIVI